MPTDYSSRKTSFKPRTVRIKLSKAGVWHLEFLEEGELKKTVTLSTLLLAPEEIRYWIRKKG